MITVSDDQRPSDRPRVLVVDPEPEMRRLVRLGLEVDGALVLEAASLEQAGRVLDHNRDHVHARVEGVVFSDDLLTDTGVLLARKLEERCPTASVVVLSQSGLSDAPVGAAVERGDLPGLLRALALTRLDPADRLAAGGLLREGAEEIAADWQLLCRWDPLLPPDNDPPLGVEMVCAIGVAVESPQPLGWGPDPDVERVADRFAAESGGVDIVIGQLVCLREALRRALAGRVPPAEAAETEARLDMLIDRSIQVAARQSASDLHRQAFLDPLTGLLNRRGLERDLRLEIGRASRYGRRFSVMVIDLDGLKKVNDEEGHLAGDDRLRRLARAAIAALRAGDSAYRVGGDEFVVLLPEVGDAADDPVATRIIEAGGPPFSWGMATFPEDGDRLDGLLDLADHRLFEQRRARRNRAV
jgi:diguanylate cyclase (GGDEF)-like protein